VHGHGNEEVSAVLVSAAFGTGATGGVLASANGRVITLNLN
jgi:hypothetical protein